MKETIVTKIKNIEQSHHVKILYACEAGSQAWGLESPKSDYDVRFIYVHPMDFYLSIDPVGTSQKHDTIEIPIQDNLDINGWELTKALRLLRKSNPSLLEWLHSPIVYYQAYSTIDCMKNLLPNIMDNKACILHYLHMAKSNYNLYKNESKQSIKTIINIIRPLLIIKWLETNKSFPTCTFQELVDKLIYDEYLHTSMNHLIKQKVNPNHTTKHNFIHLVNFANDEILRLKNDVNGLSKNKFNHTESLNKLFRTTLHEAWT